MTVLHSKQITGTIVSCLEQDLFRNTIDKSHELNAETSLLKEGMIQTIYSKND